MLVVKECYKQTDVRHRHRRRKFGVVNNTDHL